MLLLIALLLKALHVMGRSGYYIAEKEDRPLEDPPLYFMDDPEPKPPELFDKWHYVEDFDKKVPGEERLVGDMFAGRSEFPFIVDVRFDLPEEDYELHSTGNLITRTRVLTVCRTVLYANAYRQQHEPPTNPHEHPVDLTVVDGLRYSMNLHEERISIKVRYCANFLWIKFPLFAQHYPLEINREESYEGGEQNVRHIAAHPKCEENALVYDFAILALQSDVVPVPPTLTFIPAYINEKLAEMTEFDLSRHIGERKVCHVASFGRPYKNSPNPPFTDYKVRYRVYYTSWGDCSKIWDLVGHPVQEGVQKPYWCGQYGTTCSLDVNDRPHLMCFNIRAKIGSVCDHDRGSPIICEGKVYGFVTRGAEFKFCSTAIHVPFIAVKITTIKEYFKVTNYQRFSMPRTPKPVLKGYFHMGGAQGRRSPAATLESSTALIAGVLFGILIRNTLRASLFDLPR